MPGARYARVSPPHPPQEGTIASQVQVLKSYLHQHGWHLLPEHAYRDEGISGARLDRPARARLRDAAPRGDFDAVTVWSPARLARNYAHPGLLIEACEKLHVQLICLQNPCGDTPQGQLLPQRPGRIAEDERAQMLERTRRGRFETARRGACMPWAYSCDGYRSRPRRHGSPPQVVSAPAAAEVVRSIYRARGEAPLSCRQLTKRLQASHTPTPAGQHQVWHPATVSSMLPQCVYAGQARYHDRQPVGPGSRKTPEAPLRALNTGRRYRPAPEGVWSDAPAMIAPERCESTQRP
jgi:site-specific DNA recombinase